jgi:hypothetical protein
MGGGKADPEGGKEREKEKEKGEGFQDSITAINKTFHLEK